MLTKQQRRAQRRYNAIHQQRAEAEAAYQLALLRRREANKTVTREAPELRRILGV